MEEDMRILLVDDHAVVREGMKHMLAQEEGMEVVGESANGQEALSQVEMLNPNIVLTDIKMPGMDGIELIGYLKEQYASCKIIVLTMYDEYLASAMEAGARGYLLKDVKVKELTQAIRRVHLGEVVISQSFAPEIRTEYEQKYGKKEEVDIVEEADMVEELQLVVPPPVESKQLMGFASRVEEIFNSSLLHIVGSWQNGTALTISLRSATPMADILNKLAEMPEIEEVVEKPPTETFVSNLLKKARAIPRTSRRKRRTILVKLKPL